MTKKLPAALSQFSFCEGKATIPFSYDIIGDIAIIRFLLEGNEKETAEAILSIHKNVRTVLCQRGKVTGDFRLRELSHIAGESRTVTVHRESKCLFSVDVEKCYFSPRLNFERLRISNLVGFGETVVNMFAGVGCFSILIAKRSEASRVFSIDINPNAIQFMRQNIRLNCVQGKVIPLLGDADAIIQDSLQNVADRVLMPLPEKAIACLKFALSALRQSSGWIHFYGFEHARKKEDPVEKTKVAVTERLRSLGFEFEVPSSRIVRSIGPNWYQTVLDLHILAGPRNFINNTKICF